MTALPAPAAAPRRPLRILYLHQYFVPPDGSGGTRSLEMARRLVRAGHRVEVVTSSAMFPPHYRFDRPVTRLEIEGIGVRVIRVPYSNRMGYARRMLAFADFALRSAWEAMGGEGVDVVLATSTPLTIALPGVLARLRHRCPMVFEVRDLWPEMPVAVGALRNPALIAAARALERFAYRSSARVVALSPGMRDGVVRAGYAPERVRVIPNASDVALFGAPGAREAGEAFLERHPQLRGGPLVTYAGTLGPVNGVEYLADVAAEAASVAPELRFVVAGDGRERERVEARARERGVLGRSFWMIPPVPKREVPGLLAASTVCASLFVDLPEMWHNSANKFFDALAAGRPVMINYGGWQAELLERSGAGVVVPPRDPAGAARRLAAFVGDPARLAAGAEAAARLARTEFDRDRLAAELRAVLEEAAGV